MVECMEICIIREWRERLEINKKFKRIIYMNISNKIKKEEVNEK
jgi:hypothetical protein